MENGLAERGEIGQRAARFDWLFVGFLVLAVVLGGWSMRRSRQLREAVVAFRACMARAAASCAGAEVQRMASHGAEPLRAALRQALERQTPRASSVAFLLQRSRRHRPSTLPVDLSRRPELADVHVQPHEPEDYDELSQSEAESESE